MSEITHTNVCTKLNKGRQELNVCAESQDKQYRLKFERPFGEDSPFTHVETNEPNNVDETEKKESVRKIKQELINQDYPIFTGNSGLKPLSTGTLRVKFGICEDELSLYSHRGTIGISKVSPSEYENFDARVQLQREDSEDVSEFTIHVDDGTLPPNWCLIDLVKMVNNEFLDDSHPKILNSDSVKFEISRD